MRIFWVQIEDDRKYTSSFFEDIKFLHEGSDESDEIIIRYKAVNNFGSYEIKLSNKKSVWQYKKYKDDLAPFENPPSADIFIYSGHAIALYLVEQYHIKEFIPLIKKINPKLIIFDCCYMGCLKTVQYMYGLADYLICCSTTSPNFGFVGRNMLKNLRMKRLESACKNIIDDFIERNEQAGSLNYRTNGLLVDLKADKKIMDAADEVQTYFEENKNKFVKIEKTSYKYGVWIDSVVGQMGNKKELKESLEKLVLYYSQNTPLKEYLDGEKINIGLSLIEE